uniref:AB hydrolase-1 domain-containing protein n=1 Tax=Phaeocystis antarctica TaxID=33657 RepID=A0A7S0EEV9_9EUKA
MVVAPELPVGFTVTFTVDANGDIADKGFEITKSTIELPSSTPPLTPPLMLNIDRKAEALVYQPAEGTPKGGVVFLHGFSQKPKNYETTLCSLAAAGFKVVAPTTWLGDVVWPWVSVDGYSGSSPPGKLQSAIIVDGLRAMESLRQELPGKPVSLVGHSMGGACALVIPSLTTAEITSVFTMSPAAAVSQVTDLNPYLAGDVSTYAELFKAYGSTPQLVLVSAEKDKIVPAETVRAVYDAAADSKVPSALIALQTGSHIGFEDKVNIDLPGGLKIKGVSVALLFNVVDFLLYQANALQGLLGNFDTQLSTSKVLVNRLNAAYSGGDLLADLIVFDEPVKDWGAESQLDTKDDKLKETLRNPLQGR